MTIERINAARAEIARIDDDLRTIDVDASRLMVDRAAFLRRGRVGAALTDLGRRLSALESRRSELRARRVERETNIHRLAEGLLERRTPEDAVATLDGRLPMALLPVRIETRFAEGGLALHVRIFPDAIHIDAHDPALTLDEVEAGQWYWRTRWPAPASDELATSAWESITGRFRPARARFVVDHLRPTNPLGVDEPVFPEVPVRPSGPGRGAQATALPERWAAIGYQDGPEGPVEVFRVWSTRVPDRLAVTPSLTPEKPSAEGELPRDPALDWLRDPEAARGAGVLLTVRQSDLRSGQLRAGLRRLVVVGVDWTQTPAGAAAQLDELFAAHAATGKLEFVAQGTPTNNTGERRAGFDTSRQAAVIAHAPHRSRELADGAAARRLAAALGIREPTLASAPGADRREHAWASALVDVLWEATGGYFLDEMLEPLVKDDDIDVLRDHAASHLFAAGPLPTIRVGAQPYGVLPVVASGRLGEPAGRAERIISTVGGKLRELFRSRVSEVPHLGRAAERERIDETLVALLQRTPVPWTLYYRHLVGPVQRMAMGIDWAKRAVFQGDWVAQIFAWLGVLEQPRLGELAHDGARHRLRVPLVTKGEAGTGWIAEILASLADKDARRQLDLRQDSAALLEALVAFAAVRELDRYAADQVARHLRATMDVAARRDVARFLERPRVRAPDTIRVEARPPSQGTVLDFQTPHELAAARIPGLTGGDTVAAKVSADLAAARAAGLTGAIRRAEDPLHRLARFEHALVTLASAPVDELEWAMRGLLDCFSTRLDAWLTSLATARLARHRGEQSGTHLGCFGWVENLGPDRGSAADSAGYIHAPSLAHATAAAVLRAGRMSHRNASGEVFDLEITSARTREALKLLAGVAQGQPLAALLGYRVERRLRASLTLARYILPLRQTAPLRLADEEHDEPLESTVARDVVDGLTLLQRWRDDRGELLDAAQVAGPDRDAVNAALGDVAGLYDAVSDVQVAEAVYQAALGNLDRAGAALAGHDRQERPPEPEFVRTPRSGHTIGARVVIALQDEGPAPGWPRSDPRRLAEPRLDAWLGRVLGPADRLIVSGRLVRGDGTSRPLAPVRLSELGIGPISVVLTAQRPGGEQPSELEMALALRFAAQVDDAGEGDHVELLAEGGLGLVRALVSHAAPLLGAPALTAAEFSAQGEPEASTLAIDELAARANAVVLALSAAHAVVRAAGGDASQQSAALAMALPFAPLDALPRVPVNHPDALEILGEQLVAVDTRLTAVAMAVAALRATPLPDDGAAALTRHRELIRAALGAGQPLLPAFTLAASAEVAASLDDRTALLGGDGRAPAVWLHQRALTRPPLDPLAALLTHLEACDVDVTTELLVVQRPHCPGARWCGLPFNTKGPAPVGPAPAGTVGVVIHAQQPLRLDAPLAGLAVDGWSETIPAAAETTAMSFHYDAPGSRAPQAVLLAVHPAAAPDKWDFATLLDTVVEAIDLTHLRAVGAPELTAIGSLLPGLYLPFNYTHDTPGLSFWELQAASQRFSGETRLAHVLGKD